MTETHQLVIYYAELLKWMCACGCMFWSWVTSIELCLQRRMLFAAKRKQSFYILSTHSLSYSAISMQWESVVLFFNLRVKRANEQRDNHMLEIKIATNEIIEATSEKNHFIRWALDEQEIHAMRKFHISLHFYSEFIKLRPIDFIMWKEKRPKINGRGNETERKFSVKKLTR